MAWPVGKKTLRCVPRPEQLVRRAWSAESSGLGLPKLEQGGNQRWRQQWRRQWLVRCCIHQRANRLHRYNCSPRSGLHPWPVDCVSGVLTGWLHAEMDSQREGWLTALPGGLRHCVAARMRSSSATPSSNSSNSSESMLATRPRWYAERDQLRTGTWRLVVRRDCGCRCAPFVVSLRSGRQAETRLLGHREVKTRAGASV